MCRFLGDHQRGRTGIARGDARHDRGVGDAQTGDAVHAQFGIDHCVRVIAHAASADRVENRGADPGGGFVQLFFALQAVAGQVFHRFEGLQGRCGNDAPGQANGVGRDAQILRMAQVVGLNQRRVLRVGGADFHPAATLRAQVADRCGEGGEGVQRFTEALQRQRLHVIFQVRRGLLRPRTSERAELTGRHGQRAAAVIQIAQAHAHLAPQAAGDLVQGAGIFQFVDQAQLQVILQVAADAGQFMRDADAQPLQEWARADPGTLQDARRADRTGAQDDFLASLEGPGLALPASDDRCSAAIVQQHAVDFDAGQHGQVGAMADGLEKRLGRVPADPGLLIDLKVAAAFVVALVEVIDAGDAALLGGAAEGIENRPRQALAFDPPLAGTTVKRRVAGKVAFAFLEQRQDVLPAPARIALGSPAVVVARLAAHVDHAVDRGAATEHFAAWIAQGSALQAGLGFGLEAPVGARVADTEQVTHRDVNPRIVIAAAGFEQQYAVLRVGRQPIGQQTTGGPGTDHDVVVLIKGSLHP